MTHALYNGSDLAANLALVRQRVADACARAGRDPTQIRLLAVSKGQSADAIRAMRALGPREFGENYAQELLAKAESLRDLDIHWVFLGHIQSNKIKRVVEVAAEIQALDDPRHAALIARAARDCGKAPYPVYIAVNAGEESQKTGVEPADAPSFAAQIARDCPELDIQGVMSVPPFSYDDDQFTGEVPPLYRSLAEVASRVGRGKLSLGMSDDLVMAIAAGSTGVRIGRALFGERARRENASNGNTIDTPAIK